ncbi:choline kinase, cytoplasm [Mycena amicta]|nr:choline kinase, cytoplasm [Mycena amicta]
MNSLISIHPTDRPSLAPSSASSSSSILFADGQVDVVTADGVRHAQLKLDARHYKQPAFAAHLLQCLRNLNVPTWIHEEIQPHHLRIFKVSGSLTNAVFFVSSPLPEPRTVLLRIYGPSSGSLISRERELLTLHVLSSEYHIGPRVFGTFENGRVEEYFDSTTLTASDLRDPKISRWIGARMAELHSVDVEAIERTSPDNRGEGKGWEIGAKKNVKSWIFPARDVLALPAVSDALREELDLDGFMRSWERYMHWLASVDNVHKGSRRVFAHNDTQYGNLLLLTKRNETLPEHRQIIVVDFEYASPNPASFDIANHFIEWTANYHSELPHILDHTRYPSKEERYNFYMAYLEHATVSPTERPLPKFELIGLLHDLDEQVRAWSPASHALWTIWGIVQAREDIENHVQEPEFDYVSYARCRRAAFMHQLKELGLIGRWTQDDDSFEKSKTCQTRGKRRIAKQDKGR